MYTCSIVHIVESPQIVEILVENFNGKKKSVWHHTGTGNPWV